MVQCLKVGDEIFARQAMCAERGINMPRHVLLFITQSPGEQRKYSLKASIGDRASSMVWITMQALLSEEGLC